MPIKCQWREKNRLLYNIDGQVYPCCYLVNNNYMKGDNQYVMKEYNKNKKELNIFNNDFNSINNHSWWNILEESWKDSDITLHQCIRWCTTKE
jgi:hypothetical protein|tara:strand:- start:401 stop:679 length:279 start_codon:yes stop_codon:yes gene_type:complete